jgi:hypothetical protein
LTIDNFIPAVWSAKLLDNLNDEHVFVALLNRDYEGEISQAGDSVRINSVGRITIGSYTKDGTTTRQNVTGAGQSMVVDQADYFDFEIDNIDKRQQDGAWPTRPMRSSQHSLRRASQPGTS